MFTLSPDLQSNIPDGYELVPIDRITDEYEIVPWNEVQTLLNVTVVHPDKRETILPSIPHSTYAPPVSPYKEAGYSTSTYLNSFKVENHPNPYHAAPEVPKTWYKPPPISPDLPALPTLYYDDLGAIKLPGMYNQNCISRVNVVKEDFPLISFQACTSAKVLNLLHQRTSNNYILMTLDITITSMLTLKSSILALILLQTNMKLMATNCLL